MNFSDYEDETKRQKAFLTDRTVYTRVYNIPARSESTLLPNLGDDLPYKADESETVDATLGPFISAIEPEQQPQGASRRVVVKAEKFLSET